MDELSPETVCCNGDGEKECKFDAMGEEYSYPCCPWCFEEDWAGACTIEGFIGIALLGTTQGTCYGCAAGDVRFTDGDQSSCENKGICSDPDGEGCDDKNCCSAENFTSAVWMQNASALSKEQCEEANYCALCPLCPHQADSKHGCETCGMCSGGSMPGAEDENDCISNGGNFTPATWSAVNAASEDQCQDELAGRWRKVQRYEEGQVLDDRTVNSQWAPFQVGPTHKEPEHLLPTDCVDPTQFLADAAAGMTAQAAFDANPQYYEERIYRGSVIRAVLSNNESAVERSRITFSEFKYPLCWIGLWEPTNKGEVIFESSSRTYAMVLNPMNLAGGEPLSFTGAGDVSVLGGTSAGSINFASTGKVEVYGVENSGPIVATGSQYIIIANVTNRAGGTLVATEVTATLINIWNEGEVLASGNFTGYDIVNMANVTVTSGSIDLYFSCPQTGIIDIKEGVTGSITYHEGCKGTIIVPGTVQEIVIADPATTTNTSTTTATMTNTTATMTTTGTNTTATVTVTTATNSTATATMTTTSATATDTTSTMTSTTSTATTSTATTSTVTTATTATLTVSTTTTTAAGLSADTGARAVVTGAALFVASLVAALS